MFQPKIMHYSLLIINYSLFTNNMCRVSAPTLTRATKKPLKNYTHYLICGGN